MPRYVLHIGPHKTGTSYLQVLFRDLSTQLQSRGILYPPHWTAEFVLGHAALARRLQEERDEKLQLEFDELNASGSEIVLISAEDLSNLSTKQIATLRECIGEHPISVVFYCRRWLELLPSVWQELIKHGRTFNLPEFVALQLVNPLDSLPLNYARTLDKFAAVFARENVFLVSYSSIVDSGGNIAEHFFREFLSWPDAPVARKSRVNASLSLLDTEMVRILNAMQAIRAGAADARIRDRYLKKREELDLDIPRAAMERHNALLRLDENAPGLRRMQDDIFEQYGDRLMPPRAEGVFFTRRQGGMKYIDSGYLLEPGVLQAIGAIDAKLITAS